MVTRDAPRARTKHVLLCALIVGVWLGVNWLPWLGSGLYEPQIEAQLFGQLSPWDGRQIIKLTQRSQRGGTGADVDADAVRATDGPVLLNATDADRAQIVRRYRLMSSLPDEFITLKALAEMNTRSGIHKLDPRLYQYGGLWIYPSGLMVKLATAVGFVKSPSDGQSPIEFYLNRPEEFAKFYRVLRAMSLAWGVVLLACVWWMVNRATGDQWHATMVAMWVATLPVVMAMATEAKPHLGGAAMTLVAVYLGAMYVQRKHAKWLATSAIAAGCATGLVLTGALALVVPMAAAIWAKEKWAHRAIWSGLLGAFVSTVTNPFMVINAFFRPEIVGSNFGNTRAMYRVSVEGAWTAMTYGVDALGLAFVFVLIAMGVRLAGKSSAIDARAPVLLGVMSVVTLVPYTLLGGGKSTEYVRFAIVPVVGLVVLAGIWLVRAKWLVGVALLVSLGWLVFLHGQSSSLRGKSKAEVRGADRIGTYFEPAPWSMPATDLFQKQVWLLPRNLREADEVEVIVMPRNLQHELGWAVDQGEQLSWRWNSWRVERLDAASTVLPDAR